MGFSRRKMEDQRRDAAEKEAASRRASDALLEDAERLIAAWNERQAKRMSMILSPTIGAAITALLVSVGALSRVSNHQRNRLTHARSPPRRRRVEPHSCAV